VGEVKGEVVLVVEGAAKRPAADLEAAVAEAAGLVAEGTRKREAASRVGRRHGIAANELYRALLERR
jgi:16S rRNA C1402 (ribose-2'-O) methylase RsmI